MHKTHSLHPILEYKAFDPVRTPDSPLEAQTGMLSDTLFMKVGETIRSLPYAQSYVRNKLEPHTYHQKSNFMKYLISYFLLLLSLYTSTAQPYKLDTQSTTLKWTGKAAYSAYALSGTLKALEGNFTLDGSTLTAARITIDMKSLDADIKDLKKHLRSDDFFDVKRFPTATFELTEAIELKEGPTPLTGNFTIKGASQPETLQLNAQKRGGMWVFEGTFFLDRTQYGIYYNSPNFFKNLKQEAIADEFELNVQFIFKTN